MSSNSQVLFTFSYSALFIIDTDTSMAFAFLFLLVPDDNVWLYGSSFHTSAEDDGPDVEIETSSVEVIGCGLCIQKYFVLIL